MGVFLNALRRLGSAPLLVRRAPRAAAFIRRGTRARRERDRRFLSVHRPTRRSRAVARVAIFECRCRRCRVGTRRRRASSIAAARGSVIPGCLPLRDGKRHAGSAWSKSTAPRAEQWSVRRVDLHPGATGDTGHPKRTKKGRPRSPRRCRKTKCRAGDSCPVPFPKARVNVGAFSSVAAILPKPALLQFPNAKRG